MADAEAVPPAQTLAQAAAQDLRMLAWLHAAERDARTWQGLWHAGFPQGLALVDAQGAASQAMHRALAALDAALREGGDPGAGTQPAGAGETSGVRRGGEPTLDDWLACDYAGIYLTHALRASPHESVWLDEDQLMLQSPTFAVRAAYAMHGMGVPGWRHMADDHLAHELSFLAHLLDAEEPAAAWAFLQEHLLAWLPRFAERVAERADTRIYPALAGLTLEAAQALQAACRAASTDAARDAAQRAMRAAAQPPALPGTVSVAVPRPGAGPTRASSAAP